MTNIECGILTTPNDLTKVVAIEYLLRQPGFYEADRVAKQKILSCLDLNGTFVQTFDLVFLPNMVARKCPPESVTTTIENVLLVKVKFGRKHVRGDSETYSFQTSNRERKRSNIIGDKFRYCLVTFDEGTLSHTLFTLPETEPLIKTERPH